MNKKSIGLIALTFVLGAASTIAMTSMAFRGDPGVQGPNFNPEQHEAVVQAMESGDYATWKELMGDRGRITEVIDESNFAQFVEIHQLMMNGQVEEAEALREQLGLGSPRGPGPHGGRVCEKWADEE